MRKEYKRDLCYLLAFLICLLWYYIFYISGCDWVRGPLHFVQGCYNYNIDWNSFIAPTGIIVMFVIPVILLYFIIRIIHVSWNFIWGLSKKATSKKTKK